jgi:hypothetical protein
MRKLGVRTLVEHAEQHTDFFSSPWHLSQSSSCVAEVGSFISSIVRCDNACLRLHSACASLNCHSKRLATFRTIRSAPDARGTGRFRRQVDGALNDDLGWIGQRASHCGSCSLYVAALTCISPISTDWDRLGRVPVPPRAFHRGNHRRPAPGPANAAADVH